MLQRHAQREFEPFIYTIMSNIDDHQLGIIAGYTLCEILVSTEKGNENEKINVFVQYLIP